MHSARRVARPVMVAAVLAAVVTASGTGIPPSADASATRTPSPVVREAPIEPVGRDAPGPWSVAGRGPGLEWSASESLTPPPYHVTAYTIRTIPRGSLPYVDTRLPWKTPPVPHDAAGIPMKRVGTKLYYSPAGAIQYAIRMEDAYRRSRDADYLAIADKVLAKMMAIGVRSNAGVYLPYKYSFALHGISTEVMRAPWFSAMAQGLALSLAVRLYRDTANPKYLTDANLLFATFRHVGRGVNPWVTYIDGGRYLWLEEYPENRTPSDHAANGFNFAVFGLYDYYEETHDARALQILRASLTTMRHYVGQYRIPGSYSKYCLRHGRPQAKYHTIVTWQLVFLYKISGDSYFSSMSRLFTNDYH